MTREKRTADYILTDKDVDEIIKTLEKKPCEDTVSRDAIRLKIAEMPKYTKGKNKASIRHLEDFLAKELEEPIEVTQDICRGFTIALECIGGFIKSLPPVAPTQEPMLDEIRDEISKDGSIKVAYAITNDTKTDKGIEKLVSDVLKQAKEQVLDIIDKRKVEVTNSTSITLAQERYQDLIDYFGDEEEAKTILEDREEFKAWLKRLKWHVKRADELARELEQLQEKNI